MVRRLRVGACLSLSRPVRAVRSAGRPRARGMAVPGRERRARHRRRPQRPADALEAVFPGVAARCDVLLGPYSTVLARAAGRIAADSGLLVWNHGGSGDDVQRAQPGHMISVLTPTSRYGEPFVRVLGRRARRVAA